MNTAEFIKTKLNAKVLELSLVEQENGNNIVMERCECDDNMRFVLVYDDAKAVVIC